MNKNISSLELGVLISLVVLLGIASFLSLFQPKDVLLELLIIVLIAVQLVSLAIKVRESEKDGNI
jgi:hypothetical protein